MLCVSHYTSREVVAGAEELFGWGHQETHQQEDCWEMGSSEKDLCIKCDKGGKLLVCSDSGCPIAVHEKCMGCPARFDDMGNFYCPYCLYRLAIANSRQAMENAMSKKKALSTFIDEEMMDSDKRKQKPAKGKGKERSQLSVTANVEKSSFSNNENRLDNNDFSNHCIRLEEDIEDEIAPECRSVSPCRGADGSFLDKPNEFSAIRESNSVELKDDNCQLFGHKPKSAPIVACGRDDVSCEEETVQQFEVVVVGKRVQEQLPRHVDDQKFQRDVEHHEENCNLSDSPVVEEKTSKRTPDDLETVEENGSTSVEEEHTPVREPETTASSNEGDSMSEIHSEDKGRVNTSNKLCKDSQSVSRRSKRIKLNGEHKAQSSNIDFVRRSSSTVRKSPSKIDKTIASSKLRKHEESFTKSPRNPFPSGRRKKLLWTEDEEEMLKEGVHKFSSTANKNLPWRKILEFGHHVFDSTRTPVDLKDKWRNILAKEDLAKQ